MELVLTPQSLRACIASRVPPPEIFACDCSEITDDATQSLVVQQLQDVAVHNSYYTRVFLSRYVRLLESEAAPIDDIYELYCDPLILGAKELSPTVPDVLEYTVDQMGTTVTIKETPKVISGAGTTGLRTWEAALYLSHWLNNNEHEESEKESSEHQSSEDESLKTEKSSSWLEEKSLLELGAGTGLVSLSLLKNHHRHKFSQLTITDGDSALLEKLPETFDLNELPEDVPVAIQQLLWGTTTEGNSEFVQKAPEADIVVAADVTYDSSVVPLLCDTLGDLFQQQTTVAYIAATVRNVDTLAAWEKELERFSWSVVKREEDPHTCELKCWFRKGTPEIRIYKIEPGLEGE